MITNKTLMKYWMNERENIRYLKDVESPKPWSDDSVFQTTYFCNVHREDDKVTKWIRKWIADNKSPISNGKQVVFNLIMCRLVNKPETIEYIGYWNEFAKDMWMDIMTHYRPEGAVWGSAYIVSTCGQKIGKVEYMGNLLEELQRELDKWERSGGIIQTCEDAHKLLLSFRGLSDFMAAQVVADIKHTPGMSLNHAYDFYTFAKPGPGSLRGLAWYYDEKITKSSFYTGLKQAHLELGLDHDFEMQDLQNCFCEYDKYMRVKNGTGRSKRKYPGTA